MEFVEDSLGGGVIANFDTNAVSFQEGAEAGKVVGLDEGGKGVEVGDGLELLELGCVDRGPCHGDKWSKLLDKCSFVGEEVEISAVLREKGGGRGSNNGAHGGGHTLLGLLGGG